MDTAHRISAELESLWEKLSDLKRLELDLPTDSVPASPARTSEQIKTEIETRLGLFPPLFAPALESPSLLEGLWRQQLLSYYDNPLPELFKEKLSIWLSRYCASSYFMVTHACALYNLGMTAGEIRQWVEGTSLKTAADLDQAYEVLATFPHPLDAWPDEIPFLRRV